MSSNKENSPKVLYSHAVEFPKKEQAIVTDAVEGLQIKDYVLAVGKLIGPQNIKFASRISQDRVCIYLSSQDLAGKITAPGSKVNIGSHTLSLRLLVSKAKRIILSNVCPIIPHSVIEKTLLEFDITPTSQITFLRAGIHEPEYAHIMSFRRQMYIKPEDVSKLPESLQINFEDTVYWIYPSSEKLTCFICKEEGHLARHCQSVDTANGTITSVISKVALNANETLPSLPPSSSSGDISTPPEDDNINIKSISPSKNNSEALIMPPPTSSPGCVGPSGGGIKRSLSLSTNSDRCDPPTYHEKTKKAAIDSSPTENPPTNQNKQRITSTEIETQLSAAQVFFSEKAADYPLTFDQLSLFLLETYGNHDVFGTAAKFTSNLQGLLHMLQAAYDNIDSKTLKNRVSRIKKKLEKSGYHDISSSDERD